MTAALFRERKAASWHSYIFTSTANSVCSTAHAASAGLLRAPKSSGQEAVAITDHGVMYGVIDFYRAAKAEGIKPIIGCEVYVAPRTA